MGMVVSEHPIRAPSTPSPADLSGCVSVAIEQKCEHEAEKSTASSCSNITYFRDNAILMENRRNTQSIKNHL